MKVKMRIKTLTPELVAIEDRLVSQDIEFQLGAKEKHKGPVCVEVTLRDKDDVSKFKTYLDQLVGDLPNPERKSYLKQKVEALDAEPIKELLKEIKEKCKTQDEVIKYLRDRNFKFVTGQFIQDTKLGIELKEPHLKDYQFMVRLLKEAKTFAADKYDPQLVIGIKFINGKGKSIKIYLYNKFSESLEMPWAGKSDINFKKVAHLRFPHYMTEEERLKYSAEVRKIKLAPETQPTKFMLRWKPAVDKINSKL